MAVMRDLDTSLLERPIVAELLKLGSSVEVRASEEGLDAIRERFAGWIVACESPEGIAAGRTPRRATTRPSGFVDSGRSSTWSTAISATGRVEELGRATAARRRHRRRPTGKAAPHALAAHGKRAAANTSRETGLAGAKPATLLAGGRARPSTRSCDSACAT